MIDLGTLNDEEIVSFYSAYYGAFPELTAYTRPIIDSWTDLGSRVSFDKNLQPFVGLSLGFNANTPASRKYLEETTLIEKALIAIERYLLTHQAPIPGGRFFLATDGIYKKEQSNKPVRIAQWQLKISDKAKAQIDEIIYLKNAIAKLKRENTLLKIYQQRP